MLSLITLRCLALLGLIGVANNGFAVGFRDSPTAAHFRTQTYFYRATRRIFLIRDDAV